MKIQFTGNFFEFFFISLLLLILSVITVGIATPYWVYWSSKYFFTNLEVEDAYYIKFTGSFVSYFFSSLFLLFLSIVTLGIMLPYWAYWSFKYFFTRLEIVEFAD